MNTSWEHHWITQMGAYEPGSKVVLRGKEVFTELQHLDWMGLLLYGITGRMPTGKQARLLSGIWAIATSYPDPRLWNNRIGTLAGVARSTGTLGVSAGIAVSEAVVYGQQPFFGAINLLLDIQKRLQAGEALPEILEKKIARRPRRGEKHHPAAGKQRHIAAIPGFGRPVSRRDERIEPLMSLVKELGFDKGPLVELAFAVESALLQSGRPNMYMNVAGLMAALLGDQGFSPQQQYYLWVLCFSAGIIFCAADAAVHPEGSFFPIRCSNIQYRGKKPRKWQASIP